MATGGGFFICNLSINRKKKHIKVQYNFTDTVDQASKVNPNRQYSRSSPQLTNLEGGGEVGGENSAPSASGFLDRRRFAKSSSCDCLHEFVAG